MKADVSPATAVLRKLGVEPNGAAQYSARCPSHDDATASLSIGIKPDGTVGLHCHAGCSTDDVCAAAGLTIADLFPKAVRGKAKRVPTKSMKPRTKARRAPKGAVVPVPDSELDEAWRAAKDLGPGSFTGYKLTAVYPYRLASGQVHGWRARFENKDGDKQVKPFHHDGVQWVLKEPKAPRAGKPLYRLPEVLAAEGPVFVVEGEKCADALAALGVAATTSGAAKSASKADWSPLAGRACIIWPDNDDPGEQYADEVATILQDAECAVSIVDVLALDLPNEGDDAADWIAANPAATAADVLALPLVEPKQPGVQLVRASDITAKAIDWIWPGYLARGMLTLIAGNGGTGKTTIALTIGAAITTGGKLPDGTTAAQGSVIMWSGEDAVAEVLVPRLQEAGAELSRFHFVSNGDGEVFDPATDMPRLERAARRLPDLALVIIDPIVSMVQGDSHKNAEVRRGLQPLLDLAADTGAAVVGITHYAKNTAGRSTTDRVIGSVAFSAVSRAVLATAMGQDGDGRMVRAKTNVGSPGDGFAYSIEVVEREIEGQRTQVSKIAWGQPLYGFADELLGQVEAKRTPKDEASEWLVATLHDGPVSSKELKARAEADGIAWRTVERAKEALGVSALRRAEPGKQRGRGEWVWRLPPSKHQ